MSRNVPIAVVALLLYQRFIRIGPDSTGIVDFIICLQAILEWALICPTITIARPLSLKFNTHGNLVLDSSHRDPSGMGKTSIVSEPAGIPRRSDPFHPDLSITARPIGRQNSLPEDEYCLDDIIRRTVTTEIQTTARY